MTRTPKGRGWTKPEFFASTWLPTLLVVGLVSTLNPGVPDVRLAGLIIPGRLVISVIALIVTPFLWWRVTRRGAHPVGRAALAGAVVAAILCAVPTTVFVFEIAKHGTGDGEGGLVTMAAMMYLPAVWGGALLIGAGLGALVGVAQRFLPKPTDQPPDLVPLSETDTTAHGLVGERPNPRRSALSRWLDQGSRSSVLKVLGAIMVLPLAVMAAIGYIAFEWTRTEVHVVGARAIAPRSNRVAVGFSHRWGWSRGPHRYDARVSTFGDDPVRGRVVWDSDKVPITRLEWTDQDSLLVHVDMNNDEFVPWLTSTMKTHRVHDVAVRTVIRLTPDFLMVSNPSSPDDLQIRPEDLQLSGIPASAGDSIMIHATVRNVGLRPAMGVDVEISDDRFGVLIGTRKVDIAAGGNAKIDMLWVATPPDTHQVAVRISPYIFPSEADYANNFASHRLILGATAATQR